MKPFWTKNRFPRNYNYPHFYAVRNTPEYEAKSRCSFCGTFAPDVEHMIKTPFDSAICSRCLGAFVGELEYAGCLFCDSEGVRLVKAGDRGPCICYECINDAGLILAEYKAYLLATNKSGAWDTGDEDE